MPNLPVAKVYTKEELLNLPWRKATHKPTEVEYWVVEEDGYIPLLGDQHNINVVKGDVLVTNRGRIWKAEEFFKDYDPSN